MALRPRPASNPQHRIANLSVASSLCVEPLLQCFLTCVGSSFFEKPGGANASNQSALTFALVIQVAQPRGQVSQDVATIVHLGLDIITPSSCTA